MKFSCGRVGLEPTISTLWESRDDHFSTPQYIIYWFWALWQNRTVISRLQIMCNNLYTKRATNPIYLNFLLSFILLSFKKIVISLYLIGKPYHFNHFLKYLNPYFSISPMSLSCYWELNPNFHLGLWWKNRTSSPLTGHHKG